MMNNIITELDNLLVSNFKNSNKNLDEPQEEMSIPIDSKGVAFSSYSFDKIKNGNVLFPFLNQGKKMQSMCDYILFCSNNNKLYILLIELKKGKEQVTNQLEAGKNLSQFIISTLNRVNNLKINPQIRLISIRNKNIIRKGKTNCEVKYDKNSFCTFEGNKFVIKEFLK